MSLKSKFISAFASALVVGSFAIVASAQDTKTETPKADTTKKTRPDGWVGDGVRKDRPGRDGFGRHGKMRGLAGIELTEAQKDQIKQIHEANRPDAAVVEELKAIHEARRAGTLTEDQKNRVKALREQMRTKGESVRQQVLAVLTAEQRQQLETRKAEMQKRREERREQMRQKRQSAPAVPKSTDN